MQEIVSIASLDTDRCDCTSAVFVHSTQGAIVKAAKNGAVLLVVAESVGALCKVLTDLKNVSTDASLPMVVNVTLEEDTRMLYFVMSSYLDNGKHLLQQMMRHQPAALQVAKNEPWAFSAFARMLGSAGIRGNDARAAGTEESLHTVVVLGTDNPQNRLLQMSIGSALSKPTGCLVITATDQETSQVWPRMKV